MIEELKRNAASDREFLKKELERKIADLEKEIQELKDRFEREKSGLSASADELRKEYEKKIADIKKGHEDEIKRIKDEYERRLKEQ
jgi:DNA anti-recombination protein RmuC